MNSETVAFCGKIQPVVRRDRPVVAHWPISNHTPTVRGGSAMAVISLVGQRFSRLLVTGIAERPAGVKSRWTYWWCVCDCGKHSRVSTANLRAGQVRSCGCLVSDTSRQIALRNRVHGEARGGSLKRPGTREHSSWESMRSRCLNPRNHNYPKYGGRGITVCDRWERYEHFLADMGRRPTPAHSIDRIDPDGDYEPNNCRWALPVQQARNRRRNIRYEFNGERLTAMELSELSGINFRTILSRLRRGLSIAQALTTGVKCSE